MSTLLERIASDAAKFVDPNIFGQAAIFSHTGGSPAPIYVLFNEEVEIPSLEDNNVLTTAPAAICRTADVALAARKDALLLGPTTYFVQRVEAKGGGLTMLVLSRHLVL
jgi:hypothetical protein